MSTFVHQSQFIHLFIHECSLSHLECPSISIANLDLGGLFSTEHGKGDLEN